MFAPPHDLEKVSPFRGALVVSLALGLVALGVVVCRQRLELRRLERENARRELPAAVTWRAAQARSLAVRPVRADDGVRQESFQATDAANAAGFAAAARADQKRPPSASPLTRLLENPEFFQALDRHRQATLDSRFAGLFRRLALGTEELAAFKRLLADKENVALEVVAVADSQPDGPLPVETVTASVNAARAKVEEAIRASLGQDRYAVYRDYEQTQPQRAVVAQLEQRLSYSGAPLAPAQADALVRILSAHSPVSAAPVETPAAALVVGGGAGAPAALARLQSETSAARVSEAALVESQAVLTPPQIAALREIQTEQQASLLALQFISESIPVSDTRQNAMLRLLLQ